ncbi:hypothetical protein IIY24_02560, partial [Candidatus Saccharibacteria bacterium]|nr:hypothetical protein [Candidatus Saccharibacteria bacterium]
MPDDNNPVPTPMAQTNPPLTDPMTAPAMPEPPIPATPDPVTPTVPEAPLPPAPLKRNPSSEIINEVAHKINDSHYVLIALSSDPSVDELASAIGISLYLDKLGKRTTAIYSGATPNALEFLKPEETFEPSVDALQDFVIALNKEKAEHVRCKVDGDFVKVYITPYRDRIGEEDLEFSYGDYNVDLVLALDVANGIDLDSALREHGRIMHDATIVNITTGNPGKLGEIEWSDKTASSVSEMLANLLFSIKSDVKVEKEEATAFLTGIVAATNRFSNAKTTPETMQIASRLMESGANQQLVSKNITPDIENELFNMPSLGKKANIDDPTKLNIKHGDEENVDETKQVDTAVTEKESTLLQDLKEAEANLAQAGAETTPDLGNQPVRIEGDSLLEPDLVKKDEIAPESEPVPELPPLPEPEIKPETPESPETSEIAPGPGGDIDPVINPVLPEVKGNMEKPETPESTEVSESLEPKNEPELKPTSEFDSAPPTEEETKKYGKMLEDALSSVSEPTASSLPPVENPATMNTPVTPTNPEINGVPEINYMPMPGEEILPPPPTPPIDMTGDINLETPTPVPAPTPNPISAPEPTPTPAQDPAPIDSLPAINPIQP